MKIGDLVIDHALGSTGIIVEADVTLCDNHSTTATPVRLAKKGELVEWEFAVFHDCGTIYGADTQDLELIR